MKVIAAALCISVLFLLNSCASSSRMTRLGVDASSYRAPKSEYISGGKFAGLPKRPAVPARKANFDSDLVNLWPFFLKSDDYWTALWPFIDSDSYGFAVRPFFNREGDEDSVLFPLSGWNRAKSEGWVLNTVWTKDSFAFFPLTYINDQGEMQILLFWKNGGGEWMVFPLTGDFGEWGFAGPVWWGRSRNAESMELEIDRGGFFPLVYLSGKFNYAGPVYWNKSADPENGEKKVESWGVFPLCNFSEERNFCLLAHWQFQQDSESGRRLRRWAFFPFMYDDMEGSGYCLLGYWTRRYDQETKQYKLDSGGIYPFADIKKEKGYVFPVCYWSQNLTAAGPVWWTSLGNWGIFPLAWKVGGFHLYGPFWLNYNSELELDSFGLAPVSYFSKKLNFVGPVWMDANDGSFGLFPLFFQNTQKRRGMFLPLYLYDDSGDTNSVLNILGLYHRLRYGETSVDLWGLYYRSHYGKEDKTDDTWALFPFFYYNDNRSDDSWKLNILWPLYSHSESVSSRTGAAVDPGVEISRKNTGVMLIGQNNESRNRVWRTGDSTLASALSLLWSQLGDWKIDVDSLARLIGFDASVAGTPEGRSEFKRMLLEKYAEEYDRSDYMVWPLLFGKSNYRDEDFSFFPFVKYVNKRYDVPYLQQEGIITVSSEERTSLIYSCRSVSGYADIQMRLEKVLNTLEDYERQLFDNFNKKTPSDMTVSRKRLSAMLAALGETAPLPETLLECEALRKVLPEKYGRLEDWKEWNSLLLLSGSSRGDKAESFNFFPFYSSDRDMTQGRSSWSVLGPLGYEMRRNKLDVLTVSKWNPAFLLDPGLTRFYPGMQYVEKSDNISLLLLSGGSDCRAVTAPDGMPGEDYGRLWKELQTLHREYTLIEDAPFFGRSDDSVEKARNNAAAALSSLRELAGKHNIALPDLPGKEAVREFASRLLASGREIEGGSRNYLAFLYNSEFLGDDYRFNVLGILARGHRYGKDEESFRILEFFYRYNRSGDYESRTIFPFITSRREGDRSNVSFLWRLFRREQRGDKTAYHLFFIPFGDDI